ncbi:MAG: hypothetical protein HUU02_08650 [Bacteroidetes bacterium]|nr:hypothetical protein [Bacteroidota bacterium]
MRTIIITFLVPFLLMSQDSTRVNESTSEENIALITMTGIIIPLALAGTVVSSLPPSVSIVSRDGREFGAYTIESGFGIGERRETGILSDWRLGLSYTFVIHSSVRDMFLAEVKKDFHFDFIDRRKIIMPGFHLSAGLFTDFPNEGYSVGAGAWVKTPWIGYFGFFPEHTYGITYRYNKFFGGKDFHQFSLGMTSAFTF